MNFTPTSAEILALKALEWLVGNDELFVIFLGSSGASIQDVTLGAKNPDFLGSILDFILMDDAWVKEFCEAESFKFNEPYIARQHLPGGDIPNWT